MPLQNKIIMPIILEKTSVVDERCAGYRDEIFNAIANILQHEHNHSVSRTRKIQEKIDGKLTDSAQFLAKKREEGVETERSDLWK